jgi:hypothetical protein
MNREKLKLKRETAAERTAHWASLSTKEKVADLDRRLGKNLGAVKQRTRLAAQLAEESKPKVKKEKETKKESPSPENKAEEPKAKAEPKGKSNGKKAKKD